MHQREINFDELSAIVERWKVTGRSSAGNVSTISALHPDLGAVVVIQQLPDEPRSSCKLILLSEHPLKAGCEEGVAGHPQPEASGNFSIH